MEEKTKQTPEELENEIHQIEQDFQNVVGEMTDLANIRQFTDIYRQLHTLLMDSHNKNNQLTSCAQALNSQIISNATKVSSLLKMSEDDHKCIEQYRDEFDKAWKLVTVAQEKEMKSKEICEDLKQQIENLSHLVHEQSESDAKFDEIRVDLTNYKDEKERNEKEIYVLQDEINKAQLSTLRVQESLESSKSEVDALEGSIELEMAELSKLEKAKIDYYKQIDNFKNANKLMEDDSTDIDEKIKKSKNTIEKLKLDVDVLYDQLNTAKVQCNASNVVLKESNEQLEVVKGTQASIVNRIQSVESEIKRQNRTISSEKKRSQTLDSLMEEHQQEIAEITKTRDELKADLKEVENERKEMSSKLIECSRNYNMLDSNIKAKKRDQDSQKRALMAQEIRVKKEKKELAEVRDISQFTDNGIAAEKNSIESLNTYAHQLELESKNYMQQSNDAKVNTVRHVDTTILTKAEIENSNAALHNIEQQKKEHDVIVQNIRKERDEISNTISGIERENMQLEKNINATREEILKLKVVAQQKTKDCIMEHFRSRSLEKQNNSLKEMVEITQKMTDEATSTIIKYKSEQTKLNLIILESQKDINHANAELKGIEEVITMLKQQLSQRKVDVTKEKERAESLYYELERRGSSYKTQGEMLDKLDKEMSKAVQTNRRLRNKTSTYPSLMAEKIALESNYLHERELCNKLELEFSRPLNVHRWTIMSAMNPEQYKQIQMVQYLKGKLEDAERQAIKLEKKKQEVMKEMSKTTQRVQNIRYSNESEAIIVMKKNLQQKDLELEEMRKEIEEAKTESEQLKENVMDLRLRVKETKVKSTNLKRANQNMAHPAVPPLPINQKQFEMTRLGGGFNLSSARPNTTRDVAYHNLGMDDENHENDGSQTVRPYESAQRTNRRIQNGSGLSSARSERSSSISNRVITNSEKTSKKSSQVDFSAKKRTESTSSTIRKRSRKGDEITPSSYKTNSSLSTRRKASVSSISTNDEPPSARRKSSVSANDTQLAAEKRKASSLSVSANDEPSTPKRSVETSKKSSLSTTRKKSAASSKLSTVNEEPPSARRKKEPVSNVWYDTLSSARRRAERKDAAQRPVVPPVSISSLSNDAYVPQSDASQSSRKHTSAVSSARSISSAQETGRTTQRSATGRKTPREKDVAPAQTWVPPSTSFKPQLDDMPGLIISSARRMKNDDQVQNKKHPMKTSKK